MIRNIAYIVAPREKTIGPNVRKAQGFRQVVEFTEWILWVQLFVEQTTMTRRTAP